MKLRPFGSILLVTAMLTFLFPANDAHAESSLSMNETITFFYYKDLEATAPFYEELLGLEKTMDADWVKIYRITATSSVGLVLEGRGVHEATEDKPAMLSIVTDDVDAWYEKMVAAKVTVTSELSPPESKAKPGRAPVRGFIVEDPGGYTIEFFTWQDNE